MIIIKINYPRKILWSVSLSPTSPFAYACSKSDDHNNNNHNLAWPNFYISLALFESVSHDTTILTGNRLLSSRYHYTNTRVPPLARANVFLASDNRRLACAGASHAVDSNIMFSLGKTASCAARIFVGRKIDKNAKIQTLNNL